jgi:hypothetical protein
MHFRNRKDKLIGALGKKRYTDSKEFKELEDYPREDLKKFPHFKIKLNIDEDIYGV